MKENKILNTTIEYQYLLIKVLSFLEVCKESGEGICKAWESEERDHLISQINEAIKE